ncbi:MAG: 3-oxoacyl-ACP reductase FabG [Gammaproteobacteria bacterium]
MNLENQVALVTGASRGIGSAIAGTLGACGATVIGTATSPAGLESINAAFRENKVNGSAKILDVSSQESVLALFDELGGDNISPTILVNNAGITRDNLMLRMKEDEWLDVINTNLNSIYRMTKACLKGMMKARYGRIINIGSVVALSGNPGQVNYTAAKAGIIGFSKSLAREVGSRGITVNVVAPGFIMTDMTNELSDQQKQEMSRQIALGRFGEINEVAETVAFLASASAAYITGETINVNGGLYMA